MLVDRILYINAEFAKKRKEFMEEQLSKQNIPFERFSAIVPKRSDFSKQGKYHDFYLRRYYEFNKKTNSAGPSMFGCYLSHYFIHKRAAKEGWGNYLVLEDDCLLSKDWHKKLLSLIESKKLPSDWDMVRSCWKSINGQVGLFSNSYEYSKFREASLPENDIVNGGGTHFQLIRAAASQKIIDLMDADYVFGADGVYSTHKLKIYHTRLSEVDTEYSVIEHRKNYLNRK